MRRIKIAVFSMLSILSVAALNSIKASAAAFSNVGVQSGIQTRDMTIDEGLKILGYNPSDFQIKKKMAVDERTDLTEYYGRYYDREDNLTPFEVIGVTEGYEYLDSGYIDTYIYMYTPYLINRIDKEEYTSDSIMNPLITDMSLKMDVNKEYENIDSTYFNVRLNGYASGKFDDDLQNYAGYNRAYVYSSQETKSVSSGVTRILLRIYKASDLINERKYRVEKVLYNYFNPANAKNQEGTTLPHINVKYKDKQVISSVDADTDSSAFVVKNKSVIPVEVYSYPYHIKKPFGVDYTKIYITLINKETGEYIKTAKSIGADFRIGSEKDKRFRIIDVRKASNWFTFGNVFNKNGQLSHVTEKQLSSFKNDVMPNLKEQYTLGEYPEYMWSWNFWVSDYSVFYVWYEVEKGTVVQGSCYENGLHVEYDDNGKPLGVYDKDGNRYSNIKFDEVGRLLNDDGSVKKPENSHTAEDVIAKKDHESILDKAIDMINKIKNQLKHKLTSDKNKYFIIGGIALATVGVAVIIIKKSKENE